MSNSMEEFILQELNSMSLQERYEDLHGVARPIDETPQLVEQRLAEKWRFVYN